MAGSWATVAAQHHDKPHLDTPAHPVTVEAGTRCAVLDASAVIGGHTIHRYAEKLFTTQEVSSEIQDRQSKQVLSTLPDGIVVQEPTEAAVATGKAIISVLQSAASEGSALCNYHLINSCVCVAVTNFARAIGEIHSLSRADVHLIALAWSLHTTLHGEHSLHREPAPARATAKGKPGNRLMPGWGAAGGKWEEMDRLEEAEKAALEQAQGKLATWHSHFTPISWNRPVFRQTSPNKSLAKLHSHSVAGNLGHLLHCLAAHKRFPCRFSDRCGTVFNKCVP